MFLTETKSKIKSIRQGDPDWFIIDDIDGLMMAPRAGFEICGTMPCEYKLIITECINKGWLRPIANQHLHEDLIEKLTK
jgi:hypothetical protein